MSWKLGKEVGCLQLVGCMLTEEPRGSDPAKLQTGEQVEGSDPPCAVTAPGPSAAPLAPRDERASYWRHLGEEYVTHVSLEDQPPLERAFRWGMDWCGRGWLGALPTLTHSLSEEPWSPTHHHPHGFT